MTFSVLELSKWLGKPIGLLRLTRGALVERYTTADRDVTIGSETFVPLSISRSSLADSTERRKNLVTITLPIDAPAAAWWRPYPPGARVGVQWLSVHAGDDDVQVEWIGRVIGPAFTDTQLILSCEPSASSGRSRGQSLRWQKSCPLALYSQGVGMCNVDKAEHAHPADLDDVTGAVLESAAFAAVEAGRLAGGFLEWTRPDGEAEYRTIMAHDGATIVLDYGAADLDVGSSVVAYDGCKHNITDCHDHFDNRPNYGGEIFLPVKSPFDGNPV